MFRIKIVLVCQNFENLLRSGKVINSGECYMQVLFKFEVELE